MILEGQSGEELRLATDFETKVKGAAGVQNFLHHFAQLVDLDREHAAVLALIVEFLDRGAEGEIDGLDAVPKDVLETNQHRKFQAARFGFFDDVGEINGGARFV